MPSQDELVFFLQSNPLLWQLSQSKIVMAVLKKLSQESLSLQSAYFCFPSIQLPEMEEIFESFVSAEIASKTSVFGAMVFTITDKGRQFLELYQKAQKSFTIK